MLTDFQQSKLAYMFDVYDADKNGYLEQSDFEQVGQRFDSLLNLTQDRASNWFLGFWQGLAQVAGPDGRVSREAWLGFLDSLWGQPDVYEATIQAGVSFYFTALDSNGDGKLSAAEYGLFFQAMNLDQSLVDQVFPLMDENHDGSISLDEYSQRVREFYGDDPKAPGNWLLGPIPGAA
jgi:hypothetical protein